MHASTPKSLLHSTARLLVAGLCLPLLWSVNDGLSGGFAHDARKALLLGGFSAVAIVFLLPVIVRGDWVQRILALLLLAFPVLYLLGAFFIVAEQ
jgi:hypothetical protein